MRPLGFNTVAPYLPGAFAERRKERDNLRPDDDRCAEVGVMVQLDIRGHRARRRDHEKWQWLEEEIAAFKDLRHCWPTTCRAGNWVAHAGGVRGGVPAH